MRIFTTTTLGAGLVLAASITPTLGSAQGIRVIPQVGLYAPTSDLGQVTDAGVSGAIDFGKRASTLAYVLGLEFASRPSSVTLRGNIAYASQSEVSLDAVGCTTCGARSTLTALTALLVIRPLPELLVIQPYFLAGGGVKRYDFELDGSTPLDDQTTATGQLGVGTELHLGPLRVVAEISDYIDSFKAISGGNGELQNDLLFTVGIVLGGS